MALEHDTNPAALVVLAAQERERLRRSRDRFNAKLSLIRQLYERGYSRKQIVGLFEFICVPGPAPCCGSECRHGICAAAIPCCEQQLTADK